MLASSVLIVEDQILVALMLEDILTDAGLRVIGVHRTGQQALDHLRRETPDLLLLDVVLQGDLSGVDLARTARQFWSGPIIFHTSASEETVRDRMASIPNTVTVFKPVVATELLRTIRALLGPQA